MSSCRRAVTLRRSLAGTAVVVLAAAPTLAADAGWRYLGPRVEPGPCCLHQLAVDPQDSDRLLGVNSVYVRSGGLMRSVDGGETWSLVSEEPTPWHHEIAVSPDGAAWYRVASFFGPMERSTDGGASWVPVGPAGGHAVVFAPDRPEVIWGIGPAILWRSEDRGTTWNVVDDRHFLLVTPLGGGGERLLAARQGTDFDGLRLGLSEDGGRTWRPVLDRVLLLARHLGDPERVFAVQSGPATYPSPESAELLRASTDGGRTWDAPRPLPSPDRPEALAAGADGTLFLAFNSKGLWRSGDGGESWRQVGVDGLGGNLRQIVPAHGDPRVVYLAGLDVYRSLDGGETFTALDSLDLHDAHSAGWGTEDPDRLTVGPWYTTDGGARWHPSASWAELVGETIRRPLLTADGAVFAPNVGHGGVPPLLRTVDGGVSWAPVSPSGQWGLAALAPTATGERIYFAGAALDLAVGIFDVRLSWSDDLGESWSSAPILSKASLAPLVLGFAARRTPGAADRIALLHAESNPFGGLRPPVLLESVDGGAGWREVELPEGGDVSGLAFSGDDLLVWGRGLHVRTGSGWTPFGPSGPEVLVHDVEVDPRGRRLYVSDDQGIWEYRSDRAVRWRRLGAEARAADDLVLDTERGRLFAAAASGLHVYDLEVPVSCSAPRALCLGGRFASTVAWSVGEKHDPGVPRPITDDTGAFWFFAPANLELVVKVLDGCAVNGHYWVFATGLTDVAVSLTVTDTASAERWTSESPAGTAFRPVLDTAAFPTCP